MTTPLSPLTSYLGLDADFDEAADDGEGVADNKQNVPAVDELYSVSPAHAAAKSVFEELHVLLGGDIISDTRCLLRHGWKPPDKGQID